MNMFAKLAIWSTFALALVPAVLGHAAVSPVLGVNANRGDVKRPTNAVPCGNGVNIANLLNSRTVANVGANGQFRATATSFNG